MSPRKRSKPNPKAPASDEQPATESSTATQPSNEVGDSSEISDPIRKTPSRTTTSDSLAPAQSAVPSDASAKPNKPGRKWLGGTGSWRSKASPVAQIANQSIGVVRGATAELAVGKKKEGSDSPKKLLSKRRSSKGNAIPAAMTKLSVSSSGEVNENSNEAQPTTEASKEPPEQARPEDGAADPPLPPDPPKSDTPAKKDDAEQDKQAASTFGWRSWWSRPDGYTVDSAKQQQDRKDPEMTDAESTPLPGPTPSEESPDKLKDLANGDVGKDGSSDLVKAVVENTSEIKADTDSTATEKGTQGRSWFWLWSSAQNAQTNVAPSDPAATADIVPDAMKQPETEPEPVLPAPEANQTPEEVDTNDKVIAGPQQIRPPKSSGWAFWSRDKPKGEEPQDAGATRKQVGELAVADTPSQSHPEAAQFNQEDPAVPQQPAKPVRGRRKGKDTPKDSSKPATPSQTTPSRSPTRKLAVVQPQPAPKEVQKPKQEQPNLVLPEFRSTYRLIQKPTYWEQIRRYFLGNEPPAPHLHINPSPSRIKKATAIGVHGYFPAPIFQKFLGQPTGTSVRFSNAAAGAIKDWTKAHGYECEVEQVALEGEGFIADRVNTLWKLLLNWIEIVKQSDFILVACHSQGVPVAIMLVAKLIQFGCVNGAKIGICAMAGVNLGPFSEFKTRYFGATAAELFEFSNPKSLVSQMYLGALREVLASGVRIVYAGSLDDQLVSLESSTFSTISHPYIYRAVFVDGRIHNKDFITQLVSFALKLRNLGLPDHGLIRELSPALAGSIYSGDGHSRIYEDPSVYHLAISHALETTSLPPGPAQQRPSTANALSNVAVAFENADAVAKQNDPFALKINETEVAGSTNPFYLPWALRGLLEEEFVKRELGDEVEELLGMFENWRPQDKRLKDVKFRLEAVRSKL